MAQTYLTKTNPTGGNRTKGTVSVWIKRSGLSSYQNIYTELSNTDNFGGIRFNSDDTLGVFSYDSGSAQMSIITARKFRDTNGWYHIVVAWDTTDGTSTDRIKIYVNGVRETSFDGSPTYPSSSQSIYFGVGGSNYPIVIGRRGDNAEYFDGSMSHFHRVDNQALAQTVFGSTDSTTGEWKINTNPSITYTGSSDFNFFILKDGNSVTDQSGQSNNLTVGYGTLTKTEDCPSSVFATWNALDNRNASTMSNGNTKITTVSGNYSPNTSTLRTTLGKWYWEVKLAQDTNTGANEVDMVGINNNSVQSATTNPNSIGINYRGNGRVWNYGGTSETPVGDYATFSTGDIIMVAMDLSNSTTGKLYFGKNGTWGNSGNPVTGANSYDFTKGTEAWGAMVTCYSSSSSAIFEANFGNGYFGTTAVSSAGTNASNNGIFEYDVPTGYTALSTKGLNL